VKVIQVSRNIGPVRNIWNGLKYATGDLIVPMLPADLQDPPEIIPEMLMAFDDDIEVVYGVRRNRNENFVLSLFRRLYYFLIRKFGSIELPRNAGDFLLIDKKLLETILQADNSYPYFRGMVAQTNPKYKIIEYDWLPRFRGKSKNNYWTLLDEAINGIISTSKVPARLALLTGTLLSLLSIFFTLINFIVLALNHSSFNNGIPTIIIGIFLVGGIQLFFSGLIGEYVLSLHSEIRPTPKFSVTRKINLNDK
jgi:glycosyltransferase involved in cell wall biosynthesis